MITLTFFPTIGGKKFSEFQISSIKQGMDFLAFALENIVTPEAGLSLAIRERGNKDFTTIHYQQEASKVFFQIYLAESVAKKDGEGWYCLVDKDVHQPVDELVSTVWDEPEGNYFQARFSEGVLFSEDLLASKQTVIDTISKFNKDSNLWCEHGKWKYIGIV
jgi:hypothetical protein